MGGLLADVCIAARFGGPEVPGCRLGSADAVFLKLVGRDEILAVEHARAGVKCDDKILIFVLGRLQATKISASDRGRELIDPGTVVCLVPQGLFVMHMMGSAFGLGYHNNNKRADR